MLSHGHSCLRGKVGYASHTIVNILPLVFILKAYQEKNGAVVVRIIQLVAAPFW